MLGDRRRVVIEHVRPRVDSGEFPAKATRGLPLRVTARAFLEGHDPLLTWVWHWPGNSVLVPDAPPKGLIEVAMSAEPQDRFGAWITPTGVGAWSFAVVGLPDAWGGWARDLMIRHETGIDIAPDLADGAAMADARSMQPGISKADRRAMATLAMKLAAPTPVATRLPLATRDSAMALMRRTADLSHASIDGPYKLWVDREGAGFSAWYEMFPRSEGAVPPKSGTLRLAQGRLAAIAEMGFSVVYLPPIHPIGMTHRKGPNNITESGPDDPGSPWAIGSAAGGHTSVHPDLGDVADFDSFVAAAQAANLEVAIDYALQCSPDHPWVTEHPQWFRHRSDGSIRYAENPPKRYQDIYPIDFDTDDSARLWEALAGVMRFWIDHGVRIFRVDNPHTKPFVFWEWLIAEIHREHPGVLFLAEAFTRPAVMQRLAKIGFSQSYTYFTWRNSAWELGQYLTELSQTEMVDWFRPNFWVNTPDILHATLQHGGAPAFRMRAVLAAITSPSWGMYSGYELFEATPLRDGSEEYLDSEKYQLRPRDWSSPWSLAPYITRLNQIRAAHRDAIAQLSTLRIHHMTDEAMLCVSRTTPDKEDVLLLVVNLDPHHPREATTWLDLGALGIAADRPFEVHDELGGGTFTWQGPVNYVRLDPSQQIAHVLHVRRPS
ncbi:MAG TPA: maltotransferase domain-containing protein [Candidatus Saccharimonadales bacterium]|nr:maltotransferase domain-containing protein [Candidatus Saccharimonadales bacterium]